ncbi:MAG: hypothetical protein WBQ76_15850 [Candidatus Korobacteraceae bacterium]
MILSVAESPVGVLRVFTLDDLMRLFDLRGLISLMSRLDTIQDSFAGFIQEGHGGVTLIPEQVERVNQIVQEIGKYCGEVGFQNSLYKIAASKLYLEHPLQTLRSYGAVSTELRNINDVLLLDIYKHQFVQVLDDRTKYLNQDKLFGDDVHLAFPSAVFDIREAGNSLAVENNVAAIYHLMCAVEYALRAVARDRRIKFPKGQIELQQWGDILKELDKAVFGIQQWPKSKTREAAHEFYNKALLEIRSFNDAYRRHIAHARERNYNREDALGITNHVRDFMQLLATRISETKRTPPKWRGIKV